MPRESALVRTSAPPHFAPPSLFGIATSVLDRLGLPRDEIALPDPDRRLPACSQR